MEVDLKKSGVWADFCPFLSSEGKKAGVPKKGVCTVYILIRGIPPDCTRYDGRRFVGV